ncbi:hypothetical protein [Agromyces sp. ISL-38]|nr:hypothetical protein [Agromyces sp. ISL-38]
MSHHSMVRSGLTVPRVRHPAHGGREKFARGLQELLTDGIIA